MERVHRERVVRKWRGAVVGLAVLILPVCGSAAEVVQSPNPPLQFGKDRQIEQIRPKKPVRIKVHRTAKGEYSWDLTGDNVEEIVNTDKRLRKLLNIQQ